ncbi:MAG TPA: insulinase family protein [Chitinophagaceae bacterium]|nr:insulinase family protein [Chitinophagaceae bacterium]
MKVILQQAWKWVKRIIVVFFIFSILSALLFRFIPIPVTPLMLIRCVEQIAAGEPPKIHKEWVSLQEMSPNLVLAVISSEDQKFSTHFGFDFDAIEKNDLQDFYKANYTNGKCMIFVAGKLPTNINNLLNKYFGNLPFNYNKELQKNYLPVCNKTKKHSIINDTDGVQNAIRIARSFPNKIHPDYNNAQILNTILGGFFGSRLMKNIREDKGYTYGIHSFIQNHFHQTAWMISTEAGKDVCNATIEEVYKEMKLLCNEPISNDELFLVKNYLMGNLLSNQSGPFQVIAKWKSLILNNLKEDFYYNSIHTIKTTNAKDLQEIANKYLNPADFYELTVL